MRREGAERELVSDGGLMRTAGPWGQDPGRGQRLGGGRGSISGLRLRKDAVGKRGSTRERDSKERSGGTPFGKRAQWGDGLIRGLSGACVEGLSGGGSGRW